MFKFSIDISEKLIDMKADPPQQSTWKEALLVKRGLRGP